MKSFLFIHVWNVLTTRPMVGSATSFSTEQMYVREKQTAVPYLAEVTVITYEYLGYPLC